MAVLLVAASSAAIAERPFSSLEERMTGQEFVETGLIKLDDDELAALNRWIRQRSLAEGEIDRGRADGRPETARPADAAVDRRGFETRQDRSPIRSRMVGEFRQLAGDTVFELENGMVWRQTDGRRFDFPSTLENPEVEIKPGALGSWNLIVAGFNRRVGVERVR